MSSISQDREIASASRLDNVRYAIRDLACVADEVIQQGHKVLPLNVGDPLNFDFETPAHIIDAVHKAMRDGKNGYAPSEGCTRGAGGNSRRGCAQGHHDRARCLRDFRRQ